MYKRQPLFVELEVTETEPGFAGNTAQGATKPATVETGAQVHVPLFVNQGDNCLLYTSGKPILFYVPDAENFEDYRGLYFGFDKLPGPAVSTPRCV